MKWIVLFWLCIVTLYADAPPKLWTTPLASAIESSEGIVGSDGAEAPTVDTEALTGDVTVEENLDDIPLAKTYPVDSAPRTHVAVNEEVHSDFDTKVDRIVEQIQQTPTPAQKRTTPPQRSVENGAKRHVGNSISDPQATETDHPKAPSDTALWLTLFTSYPLLSAALGLTLVALILLIWRLRAGAGAGQSAEAVPAEAAAPGMPARSGSAGSPSLLIAFNRLRGEVHMAFLERKQNILFNDEFTQYQKAKALIELEKAYAAIEFFDLPELFSDDFGRFTEAQRKLSNKPELRGVIEKFVASVLQQATFTPAQKDIIRKNLQNHYNTHRHRWQYDETLEKKPDEAQTAYLLQ